MPELTNTIGVGRGVDLGVGRGVDLIQVDRLTDIIHLTKSTKIK